MEFLTILLSSVIGLVSVAGLVVDRTAENAIRSQFEKVEHLQVRVDNAPSYQLLQGKVERVRIAGRQLQLKGQLRIAALELETDPIDVTLRSLEQRQLKLKRPLQAGVRLVLTQEHINQALQSREIAEELRHLVINESKVTDEPQQRYNFVNPRVEFLDNRLRFQVELQQQGNISKPLAIIIESGLSVVAGRLIQLFDPSVSVNAEAVSNQFVSAIATNLAKRLDFRNLENYGLTARVLQLKVTPQKLEIAVFLRVEPSSPFLKNLR